MQMLFKLNIVIVALMMMLLIATIHINTIEASKFTCSLDDMKLFAAEACENIFVENDPNTRDKREIWNKKYLKNSITEDKYLNEKSYFNTNMVRIRRKDYPHGGFLKIQLEHAKLLTHKDMDYKIVHRKLHNYNNFMKKPMLRNKRENVDSFVHIPYCCTNNCRTDFFCRRRR